MNNREHILFEVSEFARKAHQGQTRKYSPEPFIVHPIRVMQICEDYVSDIPVLCAALLHDVLEDTKVTKEEISSFLIALIGHSKADKTLHLVVELTDVYTKKNYPRFNRRRRKALELKRISKTSAGAQTVKYADIIDNCREIAIQDPDFGKVFLYESNELLNNMPLGNKELYGKARNIVQDGLKELKKRDKNKQNSTHHSPKKDLDYAE